MSAPHRGRAITRIAREAGRFLLGLALLFLADVLEGAALACAEAGLALARKRT